MLFSGYRLHALYSLYLFSFAWVLLNKRKEVSANRAQITARISVLEAFSRALRSADGSSSNFELERLERLASSQNGPAPGYTDEVITLKETFLGRKRQNNATNSGDWSKADVIPISVHVLCTSLTWSVVRKKVIARF